LRRATFQTSPQLPHRQYVFSSGVRAVVVIEGDWQAGQAAGTLTSGADGPVVSPLPNLYEFTGPPGQIQTTFSLGAGRKRARHLSWMPAPPVRRRKEKRLPCAPHSRLWWGLGRDGL